MKKISLDQHKLLGFKILSPLPKIGDKVIKRSGTATTTGPLHSAKIGVKLGLKGR